MDRDTVWQAVETARLAAADLLADLSPREWEHRSLCPAWRVRDVAAHLTLAPQVSMRDSVVAVVRARGNFNRMIRDTAVRKAAVPPGQLVDEVRSIASSHRLAPMTTHLDPLMDTLVHTQDIAVPLGRRVPMPVEAARASTEHVWSRGFPFHAQRKLRGFRLEATDTEWSGGAGRTLRGPIEALLLLVTGRPAALEKLDGEGKAELKERLSP
ncbi:MAG TPA: maleylpyruvate isomerase family mycothiol-dependent enzyme [Amycolatopsis sp.]|nr:maleylpyruvate isomerase family mycothiol-dependent enzyme [Amycolatopsis sp.]